MLWGRTCFDAIKRDRELDGIALKKQPRPVEAQIPDIIRVIQDGANPLADSGRQSQLDNKALCVAAGGGHPGPHQLRHVGIPKPERQEISGHGKRQEGDSDCEHSKLQQAHHQE